MIGLLDDLFLQIITMVVKNLVYSWCSWQLGQAMHVRATSVLPLKPQPVM